VDVPAATPANSIANRLGEALPMPEQGAPASLVVSQLNALSCQCRRFPLDLGNRRGSEACDALRQLNEHSDDDAEESRNLRHYLLGSSHRDETRLRLHPLDPGANFWKVIERETAFVGDVGISKERNVGDGVAADEKIIAT
jgi:hypothetical protein